jgi:hypothetical protein
LERNELESFVGFAPIQIAAACLLELASEKDAMSEVVYIASTKVLVNVMKFLVQNGGRLSLDVPALTRSGQSRESTSSSSVGEESTNENDGGISKLRSQLKVQSNKELTKVRFLLLPGRFSSLTSLPLKIRQLPVAPTISLVPFAGKHSACW